MTLRLSYVNAMKELKVTARRQIKIISLEYSGSTLLDLFLSTQIDGALSLGEVERSFSPSSYHHVCSCGDHNCLVWSSRRNYSYSTFLDHIKTSCIAIDSSKTLSSLMSTSDSNTDVVFLYKDCLSWSKSVFRRLLQVEVRPLKAEKPWTQLLAFIRIELLRRLLLPIPFEWLYRNLRLLRACQKASSLYKSRIYILSYSEFCRQYAHFPVTSSHAHILRGNKISKNYSHIIKPPPSSAFPKTILFDDLLSHMVSKTQCLSLSDLLHSCMHTRSRDLS